MAGFAGHFHEEFPAVPHMLRVSRGWKAGVRRAFAALRQFAAATTLCRLSVIISWGS